MDTATRKDKLVLLKDFLNLETNDLLDNNPGIELYEKIIVKKRLDKNIDSCRRCVGLNIHSYTKAVSGWGNLNAKVFFIGESPCPHSMSAKYPFAWKSGRILDIILRLSELTRYDVFISNSVHCHLSTKRQPTEPEIACCSRYLHREIQIVKPKLIITLGNSAKESLEYIHNNKKAYKKNKPEYKVLKKIHPAKFLYSSTGLGDYIVKLSLEIDRA